MIESPLAGLRILDLSRILAGPVCTQLLADLGADVVKVERPGVGDDTRQWGPPFLDDDGPSAYFLSCNRGKRSLAMDLAHPASRRPLVDLIRGADALVENFLPETLAKLDLSPERTREIQPRLVRCSISGFGRTGPLANVPGYDLCAQAGAGVMSITGEAEGRPLKVGVAISDVITGLYAATSVLAGLCARERGMPGMDFDLALADCTLASLVNVAQGALLSGNDPRRYGNAHPHIVPYESFATSDGELVLAIGADRQWQKFVQVVNRADLANDGRFATNPSRVAHREILIAELRALFASRSTEEWLGLLTEAEIPHSPVRPLSRIFEDPQTNARGMVGWTTDSEGREFRLLGGAIHWRDEPPRVFAAPPSVGEHTDQVLAEWLGYSDERIADLRRVGAVA